MGDHLPGNDIGASVIGFTKVALRLIGGADFADAVGDLTGLGRVRVSDLVRQSELELSTRSGAEFRHVGEADREWVGAVLSRTYQRLAARPDRVLIQESLLGPAAIAPLVIDNLQAQDRDAIDQSSEDVRAFFSGLSQAVAHLVTSWYSSNPEANRAAVSATLGQTLQTLRAVLDGVGRLEERLRDAGAGADPDRAWRDARAAALEGLSLAADYYPSAFDNGTLGDAIAVVPIDESSFFRFEGRGLYWSAANLGGEPRALESDDIGPGEILVLLGNPGSGKTTKARSLVLAALESGEHAVYCRLEDLAQMATERDASPRATALMAFSRAVARRMRWDDAEALDRHWEKLGLAPLFVLDGLDELVTAPQHHSARRMAEQLAASGHPVVVTSRVSGYARAWPSANSHVCVAPLAPEAQADFIEKWHPVSAQSAARERIETMRASGDYEDVLSSPLTLGFVCLLADYEDVSLQQGELFDRFIDHFLRAPWRDETQRRVSVREVGLIREAAEEVAWAMANRLEDDVAVWVDFDRLSDITRDIGTAAGYPVFGAGLLIPHGPMEPLGATQQSVRWLHRAVHENLVAQRLRWQIRRGAPGWGEDLFRAVLLPGWRGAVRQLIDILEDGEGAHGAIDLLMKVLSERGDTPDDDIAYALAEFARGACTCTAMRADVARALASREKWLWSYEVHPGVALAKMRRALQQGRIGDGLLWQQLYREHDHAVDAFLVEASAELPESTDLQAVAARIKLHHAVDQDPRPMLDLIAKTRMWHDLDPLRPEQRERALQWVADRLRLADPHERMALFDAKYAIEFILGETGYGNHELEGALRLAAELGEAWSRQDHDLSKLQFPAWSLMAEYDLVLISAHLEAQGRNVDGIPASVLGLSRAVTSDCGCGRVDQPTLHITETSQELALQILDRHPQSGCAVSLDQMEAMNWALEVLISCPTINACETLMQHRGSEPSNATQLVWLDASRVTRALNSQPWADLAARVLSEPSGDAAFDGFAMCAAAELAVDPTHDHIQLSEDLIILYASEGLDRLLSNDPPIGLIQEISLPSRLKPRVVRSLVAGVLDRLEHLSHDAQWLMRRALSRYMEKGGMLPDYFDRLAVPAPEPLRSE